MDKALKQKLTLYLVLSSISFIYLVLPNQVGAGVLVFAVIQLGSLYFLAPRKKALWFFIPILILAANYLISGSYIWRLPNICIGAALFGAMYLFSQEGLSLKDTSFGICFKILETMFFSLKSFGLPIKWHSTADEERTKLLKRIMLGIFVTAPTLIFVLVLLSEADSIFSTGVDHFLISVLERMNIIIVFKIIIGILAGLYLFGLLYNAYVPSEVKEREGKGKLRGDLIIFNMLLLSILVVYTIFIVIQFKYLFAGATLPYGLTYAEYARKGFFELLFLSGVNVFLILLTVALTDTAEGFWKNVVKMLCFYLCFVTIVLLVSSFYRMRLYSVEHGLTRLRFLVFGFLIFESLGLILTFFYIARPRFNIVTVYLGIALTYYLVLNIIPMDAIIAKSQIDRYINGNRYGIDYIVTLSSDAAPQIMRLMNSGYLLKEDIIYVDRYFEGVRMLTRSEDKSWQRYNISIERAKKMQNY